MKALIKFIKLNNFKSFSGSVTVGPLEKFAVLIGYNALGKCDLMDAIDFVFGVYNLKHCGDRQPPIERSVAAIIENSNGVNVKFKRRLLADGGDDEETIAEYEYNDLPVDWPTYKAKLQLLHIDPHAVPIVLDPDTLTTLFQLDKRQLLHHFEQICGSVEFAEACAPLNAQLMALRTKCKQQHEEICVLNRKQVNVRKYCVEYNKLKAEKVSLDLLSHYLDLRTLEQEIATDAERLRSSNEALRQADNLIARNRRESIEIKRKSSVIKQRLSVAPIVLEDNHVDLEPKDMLAVQSQQIEHNEQILTYINTQMDFFEALDRNPPSDESSTQVDFMTIQNEKFDQNIKAFDDLLEWLPDPEHLTPSQQRIESTLTASFNAHVRDLCSETNRLRSPSASDQELREAERLHAEHTLSSWRTMLQHCETQNENTRNKLIELGGVYVLDTMDQQQSCGAAVSCVMNELGSSMICQDAETAERCAAFIRTEHVPVAAHGINTLLVLNGMNEPVNREMPNVPHARTVQEAIVLLPDVDIQLGNYLANVAPAVVCEPRHVRSVVSTYGVTAISTSGVTMNARGGMVMYARGDVAEDRGVDGVANVAAALNAADYELEVGAILDDEEPIGGAPMANGLGEMVRTFPSYWKDIAVQVSSQVDCGAMRAILETAKDTCLSELLPLKRNSTELKQRLSDALAIDVLASELENHQISMESLVERKSTATAVISEFQAKLADNRSTMLKMLLQLKNNNTPIAMHRGTIDLLRDDDPESLDLIEIDYTSIDEIRTADNLKDFESILQTTTDDFQRVSHRRTLVETLPRMADERRDLERTMQATQVQLNETQTRYKAKLAERIQRFRPFYAHLRDVLPDTYVQLYQNELAQTYVLPERAEEAGNVDDSIAEALSDGIVLDFIPPNRCYRQKSTWPHLEQLMAALAIMFTVYAFTRQPFVFVHQFDRLLDGVEARLKELLIDFLVAQSDGRLQIVLASDRPEMFERAGSVVGIVLMDKFESSAVNFNED